MVMVPPLENYLPETRHLKLTALGKERVRPRRRTSVVDDPLLEPYLSDCADLCSTDDRDCCPLTVCRFRYEGVKR